MKTLLILCLALSTSVFAQSRSGSDTTEEVNPVMGPHSSMETPSEAQQRMEEEDSRDTKKKSNESEMNTVPSSTPSTPATTNDKKNTSP